MARDVPLQIRHAAFELANVGTREAAFAARGVVVRDQFEIAVPGRRRVLVGGKLARGDRDQPQHVGAFRREPRGLREQAQRRLGLLESVVDKRETIERIGMFGLLPDGRFEQFPGSLVSPAIQGHDTEIVEEVEIRRL